MNEQRTERQRDADMQRERERQGEISGEIERWRNGKEKNRKRERDAERGMLEIEEEVRISRDAGRESRCEDKEGLRDSKFWQ